MHALARRTDPATSHEAAEAVERSGRAASQRHLCLLEVWKRPGSTAAEIAARNGLERHVPSRRLPELRQAGQIKNGPQRTCTVTGNPIFLPDGGAVAEQSFKNAVAFRGDNLVAPGVIETELIHQAHDDESLGTLERSIPLGLGTPRDVGLTVAFLCGEGGRYITGATLDVNGGMYLR